MTLYLEGSRLNAAAKGLRRFAASLPGAVRTSRDVQFPLGTVEISAREAFALARRAAIPKRRGASPGPGPKARGRHGPGSHIYLTDRAAATGGA